MWPFTTPNKEPIIKFKSYIGNFAVATPVTLASKLRPIWMRSQTGDKKFHRCPGMLDYANTGYIITAHTDIHIKANKVGVSIKLDNMTDIDFHNTYGPKPFDYDLVAGMAPIQDDVKKWAGKIPLPWSIQAKKGYSGYCIPALIHSNFLDKIFVYPGVVDYDNFHTVNFVFSPIKECEFTIPAGTPLLQVIPFKREGISAECDKATEKERDRHIFNIPSRITHYYRKFLSRKKSYELKCPYEHREFHGNKE